MTAWETADREPFASMTIDEFLKRTVELFPQATAYVDCDDRVSWGEFDKRVDQAAQGLITLGVEPGQRIALAMTNRMEWLVVYFAVMRVGAVLVPVNPSLTVSEVGLILDRAGVTTVVLEAAYRGRDLCAVYTEAVADRGLKPSMVVLGACEDGAGLYEFEELCQPLRPQQAREITERSSRVRADHLAYILFTSGSTGEPKGVMHSHKTIRNGVDIGTRLGLRSSDRMVLYLPLFHVFGSFAAVLSFMYAGGCLILLRQFDARASLRLMERERATVVFGVRTMYFDQMEQLADTQFDLSSLRFCFSPGPEVLVRRVQRKFGAKALNAYGMTEATAVTSLTNPEDSDALRAATSGKPLEGFRCRIVDPESGEACDLGETGELVVKGHPVMLGYYRDPDATARVLSPDGWFRTGDLATLDADGNLTFVGRVSDSYKVGGENVDPVEVEVVLMEHPDVARAAVVGRPDERLGEVGFAIVQLVPGARVEAGELIEFARGRLAGFKVPRGVRFVGEIPQTGVGKIQRANLQALAVDADYGARDVAVTASRERGKGEA